MEYFVAGNTPAAPFVSDPIEGYVEAPTSIHALEQFAAERPGRVYAARCYESADAFHKGEPAQAEWLCNIEWTKKRILEELGNPGGYSWMRPSDTEVEINGDVYAVDGPPFEGHAEAL